jgi:hypothetical protein
MRDIHSICAALLATLSPGSFADPGTYPQSPAPNIDIAQTSGSGFIGKYVP